MARPTLFTHRKFARLAADIGSEAAALGHLEFIWAAAGQSGDDLLGDARDVELAARWKGKPGALFAALLAARWISETAPGSGIWRFEDIGSRSPHLNGLDPSIPGSVYAMERLSDRAIKIGRTARPLRNRRTEIEHAEVAGVRVLCAARVKNQRVSEGRLHRLFAEHRIHGEWFAPPDESTRERIIAAVEAES